MDNTYEAYAKMYQDAQKQLLVAMNQFDNTDPTDTSAIDAAIFKICSNEKHVASIYTKLKEYEEDYQLCLA